MLHDALLSPLSSPRAVAAAATSLLLAVAAPAQAKPLPLSSSADDLRTAAAPSSTPGPSPAHQQVSAGESEIVRLADLPRVPSFRLELASRASAPSLGFNSPLLLDAYNGTAPSSGLGLLITGWILVGVGALNLATMPICSTDAIKDASANAEQNCYIASGIAGGVFIGVGLPLAIVGMNQRKKYKQWQERHAWLKHLERASIVPREGGAAAFYGFQF